LIRTIILHAESELSRPALDRVVALLNERLAGLTLDEIRRTCRARVSDLSGDDSGLVKLVMDASSMLFSEPPEERKLELDGTPNMLIQPEFREPDDVRELIAFLEDNTAVVRLLENVDDEEDPVGRARIRIGSENDADNDSEQFARFSVVTAPYQRANMRGTIGVIGPKRMNYARAVALVEGMAALMSFSLDDEEPRN
jgi:heat-inducible transcriptional repressor